VRFSALAKKLRAHEDPLTAHRILSQDGTDVLMRAAGIEDTTLRSALAPGL
jgi:hypothetical protein